MISAVLFDLDETLHDRAGSLLNFIESQHRDRFAGRVDFRTFADRFVELDAHGSLPKMHLYPRLMRELGLPHDLASELAVEYGERFCKFARAMAGALELLAWLRARDMRLGIVTNGWTEFQQRTIEAIGLRDSVDVILISEAEGVRKPDASIFHRAADRLHVQPSECLFVGDNPEADVIGSMQAGMGSIWFRRGLPWPAGEPPPAHRVDKLPEIMSILSDYDRTDC